MASRRLHLHGSGHHVLAGLGYVVEQVAQEVHLTPLPGAALEHAPDRPCQPQVGV